MNNHSLRTAILLLAYGGPGSLDDIPDYLLDIRGGRHTPQPLIDEITERYRRIGGRSPLLAITRSAGSKLQEQMKIPVAVGMRHWRPTIQETVKQMVSGGVERVVAICMAPHYSALSIGKYREALDEAIAETGRSIEVLFVDSWHTQPDYLAGLADNILQTLSRWLPAERSKVKVVFTAHSLPAFILERGDPYDRQLRETTSSLVQILDLPDDRWAFSYQSAARTGIPWLGPQIEELVAEVAAAGEKNLLIAPIGFLADHVEVLYDLDIEAKAVADKLGARLERTPMLNDSDYLVKALASLAQARLNGNLRKG